MLCAGKTALSVLLLLQAAAALPDGCYPTIKASGSPLPLTQGDGSIYTSYLIILKSGGTKAEFVSMTQIPAGTSASASYQNYTGTYECRYTADVVLSATSFFATETTRASNSPTAGGPTGYDCGNTLRGGNATYSFNATGTGYSLSSGSGPFETGPAGSYSGCSGAEVGGGSPSGGARGSAQDSDLSAASAARGGMLYVMAAGATAALLLRFV